ncbi:MAG: DUF3084 domain-containing protein [Armatimonadetes bacterium]|nr:DUF3084 domain-containing protein [Armatimonadota bacterium]
MRYSIFFAIVLVLVSGFIAYFGDLLGRKMGKKRLMLFGMRPRYTAIMMTTITGMVIAGLTLVTLISINPEFKRIFNEGAEILSRNKILSAQNAHLEKRNVDLVSRSQELENEVAKQQLEMNKAKQAMDLAVKARDAAQKNILQLKLDIAQRLNELAKLKLKNDAAGKEIKLATGQLKEVRRKLVEEQSKLRIAQLSLDTARGKLAVASANLNITEDKLAEAEKTLKEQEVALKRKDQDIKDQTAYLNEIIKKADEAQKQYDEARQLFIKHTYELRSSELILRQGEELVRGTISASSSAFGVKADLKALLDAASEKAELLGAKKGSNKRAVALIYKQLIDNDRMITSEDESNCIEMATETILGSFSEAMVQVVCAGNTIAGEQAPVEFRLYRNSQVFRSGRLIASARLDGEMSEGRILLAVIDFLRKDVSEAALRAGIIPVANPDPRASMGKDPATQVDSLMAVVVQIKNENARVKLEAYASEEVFAAGPLNMDNMRFKVTKLE